MLEYVVMHVLRNLQFECRSITEQFQSEQPDLETIRHCTDRIASLLTHINKTINDDESEDRQLKDFICSLIDHSQQLHRELQMARGRYTTIATLTGRDLAGLLWRACSPGESNMWEKFPDSLRADYERVAQTIRERYIRPSIGVSPDVGMAMAEIMHDQDKRIAALEELVRQWSVQWSPVSHVLDPESNDAVLTRHRELLEKTKELIGEKEKDNHAANE